MRGPRTETTRRARALRQADNDAEAVMWSALRNRRLNGFKFVRQFPVGPYFADFACRSGMLVVEIDGSQHAGDPKDAKRDAAIGRAGWSIVRFWNVDVLQDSEAVLETLVAILEGRLTTGVKCPEFTYKPARGAS